MNSKPICVASAVASFMAACGLEGGGLTIGQAVAVLLPALMLLVWSYTQTDWYEPAERKGRNGTINNEMYT